MEVKTVTIGEDTKCLGVVVGGDTVMVPLMTELPRRQFREVAAAFNGEDKEGAIDGFFRTYLGDAVDEMKQSDFLRVVRAWQAASEEDMGATLGE